ncbi:hypothetical protein [Roseicella sp. DB1501]|uniref:hypothetical protein n=1 Tax=Roseicella sp. DB1501 TaxID=2730925 RepID=UPI001583E285|nr:hypothetical protein [Roseicella sp. DB1501]
MSATGRATGRARPRPAHRRAAQAGQRAFIVFGGTADQPWLRLLRPGYRHCFAAIADASGWTVLDPLSGRLVMARLDLSPAFDLPGFYRRAGFAVAGPFAPGPARWRLLPPLSPFTCVALCRAVLGADAPFALTPWGLFRKLAGHRKNVLIIRLTPQDQNLVARGLGHD